MMAQSGDTLRVMTWNIHGGIGPDRQFCGLGTEQDGVDVGQCAESLEKRHTFCRCSSTYGARDQLKLNRW